MHLTPEEERILEQIERDLANLPVFGATMRVPEPARSPWRENLPTIIGFGCLALGIGIALLAWELAK